MVGLLKAPLFGVNVYNNNSCSVAKAWQQQGQQPQCQLTMTLVVSSEANDKGTDVLCVSWCL